MSVKKIFAAGCFLISAATIAIHFINKVIYLSSSLDNLLSNPSDSFYQWRFGKIYYTTKGKGKPILLIHDLNTFSSSLEWNEIITVLCKKHTVYCMDLLGCGRSDKPYLTYTNFLYVELITDFIKHVIGDKTNVIATGESGSFIVAAAHNDSSIIDKILLVNPAGINLLSKIPNKKSKFITLLINTPIFGTFIYNMFTKRKDIQSLFELDYFFNKKRIDNILVRSYYETAHTGSASPKHLFASMAGYYTTINVSHCLDSLTNSIFILIGDKNKDNILFAEEYREKLPSIELVEICDTKHLPQLEKPNEFLEQIDILFDYDEI